MEPFLPYGGVTVFREIDATGVCRFARSISETREETRQCQRGCPTDGMTRPISAE